MLNNAISKIQTEINQSANTPYAQVIGGMLLQHLEANPGSAERILAKGKTIKDSLNEMQKEARKKQVGNCAVLTDAEGFAVVLKYFGIEASVNVPVPVAPPARPAPAPSATDFDIKLDDLL